MKSLVLAGVATMGLVPSVVGSPAGLDPTSCANNACATALNNAWLFDFRKIRGFCSLAKDVTSTSELESLLVNNWLAQKTVDACNVESHPGDLASACVCANKNDFCLAKPCYLGMEERLGSKEAVADFCFLDTANENLTAQTVERPPNGIKACQTSEAMTMQAACRCSVPPDRVWQFPQCQLNDCYAAMDMLMGESTGNFCKDLLSGRAGAIYTVGKEMNCGFKNQLAACRCVHPDEPEEWPGSSSGQPQDETKDKTEETTQSETDSKEAPDCAAVLKDNFGQHITAYCKTVIDGNAQRITGGEGVLKLDNKGDVSYIVQDAKTLGCEYPDLLKACEAMVPEPHQWQFPACGDDGCYREVENHFNSSREAMDAFCKAPETQMPAAGLCRDANAVSAACSCIAADWQKPECAADACYRSLDRVLANTDTDTDMAGFCAQAFRDPFRSPEEALQGLGEGCADAEALQKACHCAAPNESLDGSDGLGDRGGHSKPPGHCFRGECFRSVDKALGGSFEAVKSFCLQTLREVYDFRNQPVTPADYAISPSMSPGCGDAKDMDEACSCLYPGDDIWPSEQCSENACYRHIETVTHSSFDFCRSWDRSRAIPDLVAAPTLDGGLDNKGCHGEQDVEEACRCVQPNPDNSWSLPHCAKTQCYPALDEALGRKPRQIVEYCEKLRQARLYEAVVPPETPAGLRDTCAEPQVLDQVCRCVVPNERQITLAVPACAANECYRAMDKVFYLNRNGVQNYCSKAIKTMADGSFQAGSSFEFAGRAFNGCRRNKTEVKAACDCVVSQPTSLNSSTSYYSYSI
ncbi:hypothetical protein CDD82_4225 [Ophiocordyceps australis]|uniref:Extracellular membrane protein CFEM domain-containing protein n=1 Tax=Ophiocordyceps australis TaxID=1399860 RepID=A0A2C5Z7B9_9HYPO|nr:hypothetical protein CDD82_4225 [Ophiocordyceps australis]